MDESYAKIMHSLAATLREHAPDKTWIATFAFLDEDGADLYLASENMCDHDLGLFIIHLVNSFANEEEN